jgi:putative ABC transport system permease protein
MNSLLMDFRFGLRMLVKNPLFTVMAILTLALGIGANTAIFSVVDAVLLRPLPYPEAERLVFLWSTMKSQGVTTSGSSIPDYQTWRDQNHVFDGLAGFYNGNFSISADGNAPELVQGAYVTTNFFQVLRVSPSLGHLFTSQAEQFGQHRVVLISYGLWQRRFAARSDIVGRDIRMAAESYRVAGVMPQGLPFSDLVQPAARMQSDYEKASFLPEAMNHYRADARLRAAFLGAAKTISSEYERGRMQKRFDRADF